MWSLLLSLSVTGMGAGAEEKTETVRFPEFKELSAPVLFPKGGEITIDRYGNYCLNGRPRFLLGAQIPNKIVGSMAPTEGYPASLKWLYEQVIDYETAQRIGFDTLSTFVSEQWVRSIDPEYRSFLFDDETLEALGKVRGEAGLPLQADFTCAPWSHGRFLEHRKQYAAQIPESAYNSRGSMSDSNHWTPYCLADPVGRELYLKMWKSGAEEMKNAGGNVLMYELFNEPAYHDPCPANRKKFLEFLKEKYGSVDTVNSVWRTKYQSLEEIAEFRDRTDSPGLYVDWSKFMESEFLKLCKEGMALIRSIDPEARFCVQSAGADNYRTISKNHVNQIELAKLCDTVSTSTGGGVSVGRNGQFTPAESVIDTPMPGPSFREDLLQRQFYRAISDGRPVHDGETYTGADYDSLHRALWLQLVRGGNASYLFLWCKRAWDPRWTPPGRHGLQNGAELRRRQRSGLHLLFQPCQLPQKLLRLSELFHVRFLLFMLSLAAFVKLQKACYSADIGFFSIIQEFVLKIHPRRQKCAEQKPGRFLLPPFARTCDRKPCAALRLRAPSAGGKFSCAKQRRSSS